MAFVQIIEFRTSKVAEMRAWRTNGRRLPRVSGRQADGCCAKTGTIPAVLQCRLLRFLPRRDGELRASRTDTFSKKMMGFADRRHPPSTTSTSSTTGSRSSEESPVTGYPLVRRPWR